MKYVLVSMFTKDTVYEDEIAGLEETVNKFKIPYKFYPIVDTGHWAQNCQKKTIVIIQAMNEHNCPIVWVDADARIKINPVLFNDDVLKDYDIAYYYLNNTAEVLSGTLWFNNTELTKDLLLKWRETNTANFGLWDQRSLQQSIENLPKLRKYLLPHSYCKIFDNRYQDTFVKNRNCHIIHYQASRKARQPRYRRKTK